MEQQHRGRTGERCASLGVALVLAACSGAPSDDKGSSLGALDAGRAPDAGAPAEEDAEEDSGARAAEDGSVGDPEDAGAAGDAGDDAGTGEPEGGPGDDGGTDHCDPTTVRGSGCASGERSGFVDLARHPDVAACAGSWEGDVKNADALCGTGFHLCRGNDPAVRALSFTDASAFCGCFAFDAAQDNYACYSGCSEQVNAGVDSFENLDMAGVGADCRYRFPNSGGCLAGGRIDATENDGIGCGYDPVLSGVLCCADLE